MNCLRQIQGVKIKAIEFRESVLYMVHPPLVKHGDKTWKKSKGVVNVN